MVVGSQAMGQTVEGWLKLLVESFTCYLILSLLTECYRFSIHYQIIVYISIYVIIMYNITIRSKARVYQVSHDFNLNSL